MPDPDRVSAPKVEGERSQKLGNKHQVRHPAPAEMGGTDPDNRYPPSSPDVEETVAYCDNHEGEARFVKRIVDVSREEEEADVPDVAQAMGGVEGWVCQVCGAFRRDLIQDDSYDWEYSNVGYHYNNLEDDAETVREKSSEGVTPPDRIHADLETKDPGDVGTPAEWEPKRHGERRED